MENNQLSGCALCMFLAIEPDPDPFDDFCDDDKKARCTLSKANPNVRSGEPYVTVSARPYQIKSECCYIPDWCPLKNTIPLINSFTGEYFFLSNYYECEVMIAPYGTFQSSEAAYQAMKCPERANEFFKLSPDKAKKLGKKVPLRADWEQVKDAVMTKVLCAKFSQHKDLMEKLVCTGDALLIEGNTWGDKYWGQVDGEGENKLGKTLMTLREVIKNNGGK